MAAPQNRTLGIQDYLVIVYNRLYVILFCMGFCLALFGIYGYMARNKYKAVNQIEVRVRSEEPLRQPLVKTTSFQRRYALMKRRLLSTAGMKQVLAACDRFDVDHVAIRLEQVRYQLESLRQTVKERKDEAEREYSSLRADENVAQTKEVIAASALRAQDIAEKYRGFNALLRDPLTTGALDAIDQILLLIETGKEIEPGHIAELSRKIETISAYIRQRFETSGVEGQNSTAIFYALRNAALQTAWQKTTQKIEQYNNVRRYRGLRADVAAMKLPESKMAAEIEARVREAFGEAMTVASLEDQLKNDVYDQLQLALRLSELQDSAEIDTRGSNFIEVSYLSPDAQLAADVVNVLVDSFKIENQRIQDDEIKEAVEVLQNEVTDSESRLDVMRRAIVEFGAKYPETFNSDPPRNLKETQMVPESQNIAMAEWQSKNQQLYGVQEEIFTKRERLKKRREEIQTMPEMIRSEDIERTNSERLRFEQFIVELRLERKKLAADSTAAHPRVREIDQEIAELERTLKGMPEFETTAIKIRPNPSYQYLRAEISDLEAHLAVLEKRESLLSGEVEKSYQLLKKMPEQIVQLNDLKRQFDTEREKLEQYRLALKTAETTKRLELDKEGTIFEVRQKADRPSRPFSPNRVLIIMVGLMVGSFFTATMVFILEYVDHSIKDLPDAHRHIRIPILGTISEFSQVAEEMKAQRAFDPFADLRKGPGQSPTPDEKKTFWERFKKLDKTPKMILLFGFGMCAAAVARDFFYPAVYYEPVAGMHAVEARALPFGMSMSDWSREEAPADAAVVETPGDPDATAPEYPLLEIPELYPDEAPADPKAEDGKPVKSRFLFD